MLLGLSLGQWFLMYDCLVSVFIEYGFTPHCIMEFYPRLRVGLAIGLVFIRLLDIFGKTFLLVLYAYYESLDFVIFVQT